MTISRRLFSRLIPATPLFANVAVKEAANLEQQSMMGAGPMAGEGGTSLGLIKEAMASPMDIAWNQFRHAQRKETHEAFYYRERLSRMVHVNDDPNIAALKSVSPQHKKHMMVQQEQRLNKERQSFVERLAEKFGVASIFKKRMSDGDEYARPTVDFFS